MTEKEKMKRISELLGEELLGMTGTSQSMTFVLKDKQVIVEDYANKTAEEIVEEIRG
jgi:hypothetical protein